MQGKASLQWYDSNWLRRYFDAQDILRLYAPEKLESFKAAFAPLHTDPSFEVKDVPALFDQAQLDEIKSVIRAIPQNDISLYEIQRFGRLIVHDHPHFTKLQHGLTGFVSKLAGEEVEPCYNFLSLYSRMGVCEPHLDAPSAKWTLDICVDQSDPWPIHFSQIVPWPDEPITIEGDWQEKIKTSPDLHFTSKTLMPGNAILFSGSSQWHYRDPLPATQRRSHCDLLFCHYIPKGTSEVVKPRNWARLFGVPQLDDIPGIQEAA